MQRFLNIEKSKLKELPSQQFELADWVYNKKIGADYHFEFDGRWFSVPFHYANSYVDLKITDEKIEIFSGNKRISVKSLDPSVNGTDPSHMPSNHKGFHDSNPTETLAWASSIGEATHTWCKNHIENKKNFANGLKAIQKLKKLVLIEKDHIKIEACCAFAVNLKNFNFSYLYEVVTKNLHAKVVTTKTSWIKDHENIRGASNYSDIGAQ